MSNELDRREFLKKTGLVITATAATAATCGGVTRLALEVAEKYGGRAENLKEILEKCDPTIIPLYEHAHHMAGFTQKSGAELMVDISQTDGWITLYYGIDNTFELYETTHLTPFSAKVLELKSDDAQKAVDILFAHYLLTKSEWQSALVVAQYKLGPEKSQELAAMASKIIPVGLNVNYTAHYGVSFQPEAAQNYDFDLAAAFPNEVIDHVIFLDTNLIRFRANGNPVELGPIPDEIVELSTQIFQENLGVTPL